MSRLQPVRERLRANGWKHVRLAVHEGEDIWKHDLWGRGDDYLLLGVSEHPNDAWYMNCRTWYKAEELAAANGKELSVLIVQGFGSFEILAKDLMPLLRETFNLADPKRACWVVRVGVL